jgi:hypothetical protein
MSSSMLEQAVIDAQALKEAAIKNAEQEVLEKYSGEIKEAVNALLEQDMDPLADPMAAAPAETDSIIEDIPLKALDGTGVNETEVGDEIELDLDALIQSVSAEMPVDPTLVDPMAAPMADPMAAPMAGDIAPEMMMEATEAELMSLLDEEAKPDYIDIDNDGDKEESMKQAAADKKEIEEELDLDEDALKAAIAEILKVDLENVPRGMAGTTHPTKQEQIRAVEIAAARDEDTAVQEENAEFEKAARKIANLEEQVKSLKSDKNRLVKEHNELKSIARQVSDKLTELNTTNVKLVYQNRILESSSLNERQKTKLVEAVSNAKSNNEAKVIFETLQDSLSSKAQSAPQNLSEAVSKNNRLILKSNKKDSQVSDSATERMKRLAGII